MAKTTSLPPGAGRAAIEAERQLLAAVLKGAEIPANIGREHFLDKKLGMVYVAAQRLARSGLKVGEREICAELARGHSAVGLDEVFIAELSLTGASPVNIGFYAENVLRAYRQRQTWAALVAAREALERGEDVGAVTSNVQAALREVPGEGANPLFMAVGEPRPTKPDWIIKNLFERDTLNCVFGESGAGKSFWALELACCITTGTPFFGHAVKRTGPVLYCAAEGQGGLTRRLRAWELARGVSLRDAPLYINRRALTLCDTVSVAELAAFIDGMSERPSLLVFDTWSRSLGADDSDPAQAAEGLRALDDLRLSHEGLAILLVHHNGHLEKNRARGWSGLRAAVDGEWRLDRCKDARLLVTATKTKDFRSHEPMGFELRDVDLGVADEDGQPVTGAVLEQADVPAGEADERPLGKNQGALLDALRAAGGSLTQAEWREACGGIDRRAFCKSKAALLDSGLIKTSGGRFSIVEGEASPRRLSSPFVARDDAAFGADRHPLSPPPFRGGDKATPKGDGGGDIQGGAS